MGKRLFDIMGKRLSIIIVTALMCSGVAAVFTEAQATVVTLKNGTVVRGEVLVNNEQVVIVKTVEGTRFQYPAAEVVSVSEHEEEEEAEAVEGDDTKKMHGKKTLILIDAGTGGTIIPHSKGGAYAGGEVMIGSRYIGNKQIFVGGGLSIHAMITPEQTYTFLPLQVAVKVPFLEGKHSPYVGAGLGCGFALSKKYKHGIYTYAQVGYRYQMKGNAMLMAGIKAQFQQTRADVTETIVAEDGTESAYITDSGLSLFTIDVNIGFAF